MGAGVWGHAAAGPLGQWREATRGASRWAGRVGVTRAQAGMGRLGLLRERGCGAGRVGAGLGAVAGWAEAEQAGRSAGELGRSGPAGREREAWAALGRAWGVGAGLGREERVGLGSGLLGFGSWVSFLFYFLFFSFSKSISNKV